MTISCMGAPAPDVSSGLPRQTSRAAVLPVLLDLVERDRDTGAGEGVLELRLPVGDGHGVEPAQVVRPPLVDDERPELHCRRRRSFGSASAEPPDPMIP